MDKLKKQGSRIAELIEKGREQGYLTYADVNDHLPEDISDPDQVDEIIGMINDLGLQVHETAPDADTLMLSESSDDQDDIALEQAAEALAAVENETGRTTDPVRMYMREMGTVDLLTREGEIEIAKRIEEGMRDLLGASVHYPGIVEHIIDFYEQVKSEDKKLSELLTGFLEEMEEVPSAGPGSEKAKQLEESDEEVDNGPDLAEVQRRMTNLKRQFNKTQKVVESKGRHSKEAKTEFAKLGLIFQFLKFSPKMFEDLAWDYLFGQYINNVDSDSKGNLWIDVVAFTGLIHFNTQTFFQQSGLFNEKDFTLLQPNVSGSLIRVNEPQSIANASINDLFIDGDDNITHTGAQGFCVRDQLCITVDVHRRGNVEHAPPGQLGKAA